MEEKGRAGTRALGGAAAAAWLIFCLTGIIRLFAGSASIMENTMLRYAPPEDTGLPGTEYRGVAELIAEYLTGSRDSFQYVFTGEDGQEYLCFHDYEEEHMADCRGLISLDTAVCAACGMAAAAFAAAGLKAGRKNGIRDFFAGALAGAGVFCGAAVLLTVWAAVNFDGFFVTFHLLAFTGDGWLLNPGTDLLIRLMPEEFFISLGLKGLAAFLPLLALTAAAALRLRRKDGADGKRPGDRDGIRDRGKGKG